MGLMGFYWVTLEYESWGVPQLIPQQRTFLKLSHGITGYLLGSLGFIEGRNRAKRQKEGDLQMKKYLLYSLDLTTKNCLEGGFRKRHKDVTQEDLQKAMKNALESLRRKARVRGWQYVVYAAISNIHRSQGGRLGAWHVHVILYGSPCSQIVKELKSYWVKRWYGNPAQCPLRSCYDGRKVNYVREQEVQGFFQKVNAEDILKELQAEGKKDTLKVLAQYQPVS